MIIRSGQLLTGIAEDFLTALGVKVGDFIDIEPTGNGFFVKNSEKANEQILHITE